MQRQARSMILGAFAATLLLAACDRSETPRQPNAGAPASTADTSVPKAVPPNPSPTEHKDGTPPVQGQVDPKDPVQAKDFQATR